MSKYIIKLDFSGTDYYVRCNETTWDEVYNPYVATTFNSKPEALEWVNANTTFGEYAKAVVAERAWSKFDKWMKNGYIRRTFNLVDKTVSRPYDPEKDTLADVIEFYINNYTDESGIRYEDYRTWPKMYELTKHINDVMRFCSDDYKQTYITFQISTSRDADFEQFENEVMGILKHVSYVDEDGRLILGVLDHNLGAYGDSIVVLYDPEERTWFTRGRSSLGHGVKYENMEKMFEYLKRERYYE